MQALILTYHSIEDMASPLCVDPALFGAHLDEIASAGARCLTIRQLAEELRAGGSDAGAVAITFDDGFASVAESAVPLLLDRGLTATVFCVAGHLGGLNDWPSGRSGGLRSQLASASAMSDLAKAGIEIGSHGMRHDPLKGAGAQRMRREVVDSKERLEAALGTQVSSFSYPYGALPERGTRELVEQTYTAACTTKLGRVPRGADPLALPRVDAHYLRRPAVLHHVLEGRLDPYLWVRGGLGSARRILASDYSNPSEEAERAETLAE